MSQSNIFHNDWLDCSALFSDDGSRLSDLPVNLDIDFFANLKLDDKSLRNYRIEAALQTKQHIGDNIALCFSGGVDSQCMVQCFKEAQINFDLYAVKFKNNLNPQDYDHALKFCNQNDIKINTIELDVLNFLSRENFDYGMKYLSASPHFNVHYKLFNILKDKGYDGVVCGGFTPLFNVDSNSWGSNYARNTMNYINYTKIAGFEAEGNFLSYYPKLSWAISLLTPSATDIIHPMSHFRYDTRLKMEKLRYKLKVIGYKRAGFNIVPQDQKYTGFELVKKHLEDKTGDGWIFEKLYRHPLERILVKHADKIPQFIFKDKEINEKVSLLYRNNLPPGFNSSSGI